MVLRNSGRVGRCRSFLKALDIFQGSLKGTHPKHYKINQKKVQKKFASLKKIFTFAAA
jgi:hypothetical protein